MKFTKTVLNPHPENIAVAIVGDVLTFKKDAAGFDPHRSISCSLSQIVAQYSQDHGVIAVGDGSDGLLAVETTAISIGLRGFPFGGAHNTSRRDSPLSIYRSLGGKGYPALYILTPYRGCALNDCTLYFFESSGVDVHPPTDVRPEIAFGNVSITIDGLPLVADEVGLLPTFLQSWLPITLNGDDAVPTGASASFIVSAPENAEVYLEATAGILNRSRVRNGESVVFSAAGLRSGTSARIKAGYKFWPGKSDITLTITEPEVAK